MQKPGLAPTFSLIVKLRAIYQALCLQSRGQANLLVSPAGFARRQWNVDPERELEISVTQRAALGEERKALSDTHHPFLVHLRFAFQSPSKLYLVMDYCNGGELFYHLKQAGRFDEPRAR